MKLKNKFLSSVALPLAFAGLMSSCEDSNCTNCNCDAYKISYISSSDSINSALDQLSSEQTVVIRGTGLSTTREAYLIDSTGVQYAVTLNPTFITDKNIIITMKSDADMIPTEKILLVSNNGCRVEYNILKPVPAPSIKLFYSEFVPDGDTLRVFGSAFIDDSQNGDSLKVWFESADAEGNPTGTKYPLASTSFMINHDNAELQIIVPEGIPNSSLLGVSNSHGLSYSKMLFRDTRNIWLDFDSLSAGETTTGAFKVGELDWNPDVIGDKTEDYAQIRQMLGGEFPKGCNGLYQVLTYAAGYDPISYLYLTPYTSFPDLPKKNLLGPWENSESVEGLCLKFEVYIPKCLPTCSQLYMVFSKYSSEDKTIVPNVYTIDKRRAYKDCYIARDFTSNKDKDEAEDGSIVCNSSTGVPGAWLHMGKYTVDEDNGTSEFKEGYYTSHGWMTVCVPLTTGDGGNFSYAISDRGIFTAYKASKHCGGFDATDFYNFFLHAGGENTDFQKKYGGFNEYMFFAMDNFRIVPEDGGGARFSKYDGVTSGSQYPF